MTIVKFLERKGVIQFFGLALIIAPFVNTFILFSTYAGAPGRWTVPVILTILGSGSIVRYLLCLFSIGIGALLLRGSASAWKYVLLLLGVYIVLQIVNLGVVPKTSRIEKIFLVVNAATFFFIASQLVWKEGGDEPVLRPIKPAVAPLVVPVEKPDTPRTTRKILITFAGFGPWAKLTSITNKGIHVQCFSLPPFELASRNIRISLKSGLSVEVRLDKRDGMNYFFKFVDPLSEDNTRMSEWLTTIAS